MNTAAAWNPTDRSADTVRTTPLRPIDHAREVLDAFLAGFDGPVVSASRVQDMLFELYGILENETVVEGIKPWLSLTIERELFGTDELRGLLRELDFAATA